MAIFTHEYAISLAVMCFAYWFIFRDRHVTVRDVLRFAPPLIIIGFWLVLKIGSQTALVVSHPSVLRFVASILKSALYFFMPVQLVDIFPKAIIVVLSLGILGILDSQAIKNKMCSFFSIWFLTTIIIFSATSLPQARYFYLSSIPAIFLVVSLLNLKKLTFLKVGYLIFLLVSSMIFIKQQEKLWVKTSEITKTTLMEIKQLYGQNRGSGNLYFINLTDSLNGPPWNAYLFRSGVKEALKMNNIAVPGKIYYFRTVPYNEIVRNDPFINEHDLQVLKEKGEAIFVYQN